MVSWGKYAECRKQGAALLYNNFMKDFLAKSNANPIPAEGKVEVRRKSASGSSYLDTACSVALPAKESTS